MTTTSLCLIERLRTTSDEAGWNRFVELYSPMLFRWAEGIGLSRDEAADLVQEVFIVLMKELPRFNYDPNKSFRAWLKTVALNRCRNFLRNQSRQPSPGLSAAAQTIVEDGETPFLEHDEYNRAVTKRALQLMQTEFESSTWKSCWECVVVGRSGKDVADDLGITENAVYLAKSRVLRRLRQEFSQLLD